MPISKIILRKSDIHTSVTCLSFTCLNDSKSTQVSRILLSILADLNNTVVRMVSILPLISKSCSFFPSLWRPFRVYQLPLFSAF